MKTMTVQNLEPIFDTRKSFYGKARVQTFDLEDWTVKVLWSYDTVWSYDTEISRVWLPKDLQAFPRVQIWSGQPCSVTTRRHLSEFLRQTIGTEDTTKVWKLVSKIRDGIPFESDVVEVIEHGDVFQNDYEDKLS